MTRRYEVKYYNTVIGWAQSVPGPNPLKGPDGISRQWVPVDMDGRQLEGGPYNVRTLAERVVRRNWDDLLAVVFGG